MSGVKTLNFPLTDDEYKAAKKIKQELGLTWKELLLNSVPKEEDEDE